MEKSGRGGCEACVAGFENFIDCDALHEGGGGGVFVGAGAEVFGGGDVLDDVGFAAVGADAADDGGAEEGHEGA